MLKMADYYAFINDTGLARFHVVELLSENAVVRITAPGHALDGRHGQIYRVRAWLERLPAGNGMRLCVEYDVRVRVSPWWKWMPSYEIATFKRGDLDVRDMLTGEERD